MSTVTWQTGTGDWNTAADWSGGVPSATTTATIGGAGSYLVTLMGAGSAASLGLNATGADFYLAGALTLTGTLGLQAGTFTLAGGGVLAGGTLAMQGGTFLSLGGTFSAAQVNGPLLLNQADETLFVTNGLACYGAAGSGLGSLSLTGAYASLDFVGSQAMRNTQVTLGAPGTQSGQAGPATIQVTNAANASTGATLTLGSAVSIRDSSGRAQIVAGNLSPLTGASLQDTLINLGLIAATSSSATLDIAGNGTLVNQGTLSAANGATLEIATQGVVNTGVISVNNATLALGGTFSASLLSSLGSVSLSAGTVSIAGTANLNGGTLSLGTGRAITNSLGALLLNGTIMNGTVADSGGGLNFADATGTLSGATYQGSLTLGAGGGLTLANGAAVNGAIAVTGAGAALLLSGAETLNNVSITLGAAGGLAELGTADPFLASNATTATLGPQTSLTLAGQYAELGANGFSPFPGIGLDDTLDNQGTITASLSGATLAIGGYGTFVNQGSLAVSNGATLTDTALTFANAGTLTVGQGGTVLLGATSGVYGATPTWSNGGQIAVTGGTLLLEGSFTTAQLGGLTETGGVIDISGTLTNGGATLTLGAASGLTNVTLLGTVTGGTIADAAGALTVGAGGTAMLQNLAYQGTLALDTAGATLSVSGGLAVSGQVQDVGAGALLAFVGSQNFGGTQLLLGAAGQAASIDLLHSYAAPGAQTLTFGPMLGIVQAGALAAIGTAAQAAGDSIVSQGSVTAATAGGTLTLGGQGFTNKGTISVSNGDTLAIAAAAFSNTGLISAAGATLLIADTVGLSALGQLSLNNAVLAVSGDLTLGGGTLALGSGSQIGALSLTGTLAGGIVSDTGGGLLANGGADLSGIIYAGLLDLSRPFSNLHFSQGLTVLPANGFGAGAISITGAESRLIASGTETLDNVTVTIGAASATYEGQTLPNPELAAAANATLTLGPTAVVTATGAVGQLGDATLGLWTDEIINQGRVTDAVNGNGFNLDASVFVNQGALTVAGGGVMWVNDVHLQNNGVFTVGAGSVVQVALFDYFAAPVSQTTVLTNTGTIAMGGGILHEMNAGGLFPGVPLLNQGGAQITGTGVMIAPISNAGTIEALGGQLTAAGTISGTGSLLIGQGATLNVANGVGPGQSATFLSSSGTLALSQPTLFTGRITNLGGGNVIDLPGQAVTFVAISNGTLAVNTPGQSFFVGSSAPLVGAVTASRDGHGGETIAYVPRTDTPGATTLSVTQPGMLFWTTPSGDILKGTASAVNGAVACNWSPYSSLDLTDMNPSLASLSVSTAGGRTVAHLTDGAHSCSVTLNASIGAGAFHLSSDGHGGTTVVT